MLSRRTVLRASLGLCSCTACGTAGLVTLVNSSRADQPTHIRGAGYDLRYVGAQRETVINGKVAAAIDLGTLAATPSLYGIGPIAELRGEVTIVDGRPSLSRVGPDGKVQVAESFDTGAPFLVWAEVPSWREIPIPAEIRSFADLEGFVPRAAESVGLDPKQALPFLVHGREELIEFHILNRIGNEPHNAEKHKKIQVSFELTQVEATIVGFHSPSHRGIFIPMDSSIHIHFQTLDNTASGHIQTLQIGPRTILRLPRSMR
jgi:acetolactate decarboxylase